MLKAVSIVIPIAPNETAHETLLGDIKHTDAQVITASERSRARSLNTGAAMAENAFIWFIHADTRVNQNNIDLLMRALDDRPNALHYFDLSFDGGGVTRLNAWGANIRSNVFGLPYGDQGFCISKTLFDEIGGYPEDSPYGEDVLFLRRAKQRGITLNRVPAPLVTSARKYIDVGWLKLTLYRQWQIFKLLRMNI